MAANGNCLPLSFDISSEDACFDAVKATVERFGGIRAVIHFAGIHHTKTWEDVAPEDFTCVYAVKVIGSFLIARAAAREMREAGGAIVLAASGGAELGGVGGDGCSGPTYIRSKVAIRGLARSLSRSLGTYNIRVNAVSPRATETPMIGTYDNVARDTAIGRTPIGRIALPEDIADVARFLISEEARFMTGQIVTVTGGSAFG